MKISEEGRSLHFNSLIIDGLEAAPMTEEHFKRLKQGGVDVVNYTCVKVDNDFSSAALNLLKLFRTIQACSDKVILVKTSADIQRAQQEQKIGIIAGFQSATPVMNNVDYIELLYHLGVRILQLTYNERNLLGDGCVESANGGLSRFGRQVVVEMNRLGMIVDVSHCAERTTLDAIEMSTAPVMISHANAFALCPSLRNKSDEVMRALAKNGGVIGAAFWAPMAYHDPNERPVFENFLNHIDYMVEKTGIDHVGIGSDLGEGESREDYEAMFLHGGGLYPEITRDLGDWYSFDTRMVDGLDTVVNFPMVTDGLFRRGYDEDDIRKIMGGNMQRVLNAVL